MENVIDTVKKKEHGLLRSTTVVSGLTFISRILGFARDMLFARYFGVTAATDAFYLAFKIPNFLRRLFAEGAFSQAFVPILSEYQTQRTHSEVKEFIRYLMGNLALVLFLVTVSVMFAAPFVVGIFAPGFVGDPQRFALATEMLRIMFPYLFFISLTAMAGAILNTYRMYAIAAFTPVLLNLIMLISVVCFFDQVSRPIIASAWGVCIAGVVQFLFQLPFLYKNDLLPMPRVFWHAPGTQRVIKQMIPALFGVSVMQINLLFDSIFASFLKVGSISLLYFADRFMQLPLGVFGVAIATVILPTLSRAFSRQSDEHFNGTLEWALRSILLIGVPCAVGLVFLSGPLFITMFSYNPKFTQADVIIGSQALMAFALGIPAFMMVKVLASAFYSQKNIKTPVRVAIVALILNTGLNFIFIYFIDAPGIALATSIAAYFNSGCLLYLLLKRYITNAEFVWGRYLKQLVTANLAMILSLYLLISPLPVWFAWSAYERIIHFALIILVAVMTYGITLWGMGMRLAEYRKQPL